MSGEKKKYLRGKNILPRQKRAKSTEAFTATWKEDGTSTKQEQHQQVGERLMEVGHANTHCSSSREGRASLCQERADQHKGHREPKARAGSPRESAGEQLGSQPCVGAAGGTGEQSSAIQARVRYTWYCCFSRISKAP